MQKEVENILEGWTKEDIHSSIEKRIQLDTLIKSLEIAKEIVNNDIKAYLKERRWDRFTDTVNKISVILSVEKRQTIDMNQLKQIINESELAQITRITTFEKLQIVTPEIRERLKKYAKRNF